METIGAEAAKMAGLQIDLLQKYRQGHIVPAHLEWFNNLTREERDVLVASGRPATEPVVPAEPVEKFALLVDLGIITVPQDYVHGTRLGAFFKQNGKKLYDYNKNITDVNFPSPSRILKPGDKLHVRAFHQIVSGATTSQERMAFLEKQAGNVYAGAQGASLVFEQKRDQLPKGKWYASFDEADRLWKDSGGHRGVPRVDADSGGDFGVNLGYLEDDWHGGGAFLSFSDVI